MCNKIEDEYYKQELDNTPKIMSSASLSDLDWDEHLSPSKRPERNLDDRKKLSNYELERRKGVKDIFDIKQAIGEAVYKKCFKGYEIQRIIGKGGTGTILLACKEECDYVAKHIFIKDETDEERFTREAELTRKMSDENIGPKFYGFWRCEDAGIIILEKWDGELDKNVCINIELINKLQTQVKDLHDMGYIHADIMEKNVLVKKEGKEIIDITLTDFGLTYEKEYFSERKPPKKKPQLSLFFSPGRHPRRHDWRV